MKSQLFNIRYTPKESIALWKYDIPNPDPSKNVFLTHGTFSNRKVCMGIVDYLLLNGYTCWIMEWRGHGESSGAKDYNFETVANSDIPTIFDYLMCTEGVNNLHCITHSGGGICLTITLINKPQYHNFIRSISFFGCQAFGAAYTITNRIKILIASRLSYILGFVPARFVGSPQNESYTLMKQWYNWNLTKTFCSQNDFDYRKAMKNIDIPILSICGAGDNVIAPPFGCRLFLEAFDNPLNKLMICGKSTGYKEDYNHSRVLHSKNASIEIYPKIGKWISIHD